MAVKGASRTGLGADLRVLGVVAQTTKGRWFGEHPIIATLSLLWSTDVPGARVIVQTLIRSLRVSCLYRSL